MPEQFLCSRRNQWDKSWRCVSTVIPEPRWLWQAIDHQTRKVVAYVCGRQDDVFLQRKALLEPFGITRFFTDH